MLHGKEGGRSLTALSPLRCIINRHGEKTAAPQFVLSTDFCEPRVLVPIKTEWRMGSHRILQKTCGPTMAQAPRKGATEPILEGCLRSTGETDVGNIDKGFVDKETSWS